MLLIVIETYPKPIQVEKSSMFLASQHHNTGMIYSALLESGVYKYSRSKMFHKKAISKFTKKTTPKAAAEKKPAFGEKKVRGTKNGGTRKVATNKPKFDYPTYSK